jgi:hypothetical protein
VTGLASNHYPETMGKLFVINAPMLFTAVWSIVKNWLDEATVCSFRLYKFVNVLSTSPYSYSLVSLFN